MMSNMSSMAIPRPQFGRGSEISSDDKEANLLYDSELLFNRHLKNNDNKARVGSMVENRNLEFMPDLLEVPRTNPS